MTLEISFSNQIFSAISLISLWCIVIAMSIWVDFEEHMVGVFVLFLAGATIPTLFLHIQYYLSDREKRAIISKDFVDVFQKGQTKRHSTSGLTN